MEYRKFDNVIVARIDKDEEILEQLRVIAIKENIKLASVQALGAINDFTVGVYKTDEKKYYSNSFQGYYEITSLTGTINTKYNGWRILCTSSYECRKSEGRGVWRTSEQSDCQCNL